MVFQVKKIDLKEGSITLEAIPTGEEDCPNVAVDALAEQVMKSLGYRKGQIWMWTPENVVWERGE